MSYRKKVLLLLAIGLSVGVWAQNAVLKVSGKVTDAQTGLPIPFVNVHVKAGSAGTATNSEGEFLIKIVSASRVDTLLLSCVGYQTAALPLVQVGANLAISLQPATVQLAEISVRAETGLDMLKKALARIPDNYDTGAVQLRAFYREHIWLGDFELGFNESILDIYKLFHYTKKPNDQIRIVKGRKKDVHFGNDLQFYYWMSSITNSARSSLGEDWIKYRQARSVPFNPANYRYYEYDYVESIKEGDRTVLVVDIVPKERARKGILRVRVYLEEQSLAIVRIDFEAAPSGIRWINRHQKGGIAYTIMTKLVGATIDFTKIKGSITYKSVNGKWHLNSVNRRWEASVNSKKRNMIDRKWVAAMDFQVTDVATENVKPFTEGDISKRDAPLSSMLSNDYDEAFWENYNVLKPTQADSVHVAPQQVADSAFASSKKKVHVSGFTRADTLRGKLSPLRTCYDVTFYHLDVAVNMAQRSIKGSNTMRFKVTEPFHRMQIDLYAAMKIHRISYQDRSLSYTRESDAVFVEFPADLPRGKEAEIKIDYEGIPKTPDWSIPMNGGVLWDRDSLGNPWVQMVCQGSGASLWWPNKDHLSDEPDSMKIWITVPAEFTEISNGRLQRKTALSEDQTRYEWYVSYPINNYNVTFSIGKYAHYTDQYIAGDTLTIDYYLMPYHPGLARKVFGQVKPMLACFEKNFGQYPFPRDGFTLVESLYPMEHQSGVCIGKITPQNSAGANPLMWHESAHEWWGNAISCTDMADLWIHEAFATYAEIMMVESLFGKEEANQSMRDQQAAMTNAEPIIGVYDVNDIFRDVGNMYSKGSLMLHTFRNVLNDDVKWIDLLHAIQDHFRYQVLTTHDLIGFINQQTGTDYTYLFDQYLRYTTLPRLVLQLEEEATGLTVRYRWQADVAGFRMPVKVTVGADRFDFIYPTSSWKMIKLKAMKAADFEADEDDFLMDVDLQEGESE